MSKLVNLTYHINNEPSSVKFDINNKLSILKELIHITQRINVDDYEILYGKKVLSFKENKYLNEIIGKDINPIFYLINIPKLQNIGKKGLKDKNAVNNQKCLVSVENAPSRAEIYTLLNKYLENKNSKQEFVAENIGSRVDITFNNPDIAYDFIKGINVEKINNPLYSKIKTNLVIPNNGNNKDTIIKKDNRNNNSISGEVKKVLLPKLRRISKNKRLVDNPKLNNSLILKDSYFKENLNNKSVASDRSHRSNKSRQKSAPKTKISTKSIADSKLLKMATNIKEIDDKKMKKKILKRYFNNSPTLRTGSPYISDDTIHYNEYLKNKSKWIDKKGLLPVINKPKPNYIPNGINYDNPYTKPIFDYDFRAI